MGNALITYMNKRLIMDTSIKKGFTGPGPVITISREAGCNGLSLARTLSNSLNQMQVDSPNWKVLSKEIFYESAKELNINLSRVTKIFSQTDRYTFEEILNAFGTRQFKSDKKIIKTVTDVIRSFSVDGYCIIVGRAGHIIASDIKKAIHIKITAPLNYRIKVIMEKHKCSEKEAITFINSIENKRKAFREIINKGKTPEDNFDLIINRASFNNASILNIIKKAIESKELLTKQEYRQMYY